MPGTTVPHPEPIGMQWLITVKKEDQKLNIILRKNELFTRAADGLIQRNLFPVTAFWVAPWTTLHFED